MMTSVTASNTNWKKKKTFMNNIKGSVFNYYFGSRSGHKSLQTTKDTDPASPTKLTKNYLFFNGLNKPFNKIMNLFMVPVP